MISFVLFCAFRYSFNMLILLLWIKKGMALTIPCSGCPERPRRSKNTYTSVKKLCTRAVLKTFIPFLCVLSVMSNLAAIINIAHPLTPH